MEQVCLEKTNSFSSINEPQILLNGFLVIRDLRFFFDQNFSLTSVKTLAMELAGLEGVNQSILKSNEPRASKTRFYQFSCTI
ncbi:hypothetical protein H5410_026494 [Solanum commersonii]|uniref:Uncharacterized protein n=1 Tax=Solanum commersonii TaxID=4109 RepID=A0A9J5YX76_SOLCO|nr:hypothetical protein H5410_026494 [Solanum commersonii]